MFTGIVEEAGHIDRIERHEDSIGLTITAPVCGEDLKQGDSLAVNGCCLTVVSIEPRSSQKAITVNLLEETWKRTNLQHGTAGAKVNLERSLPVNGRIGGHFVTGHIDGVARITRWEKVGNDYFLEVNADEAIMRYVIFKGAIAVDGISLTIASVEQDRFQIWIIPHTYNVTALPERQVGDAVNVEVDILGKYVEQFVQSPNRQQP